MDIVQGEETHTIDVRPLASSIEETMSQHLFMSPNCCIFKTPVALYRQNPKAYIPDAFSIGPFHHGNQFLKGTEIIKAKYLKNLLEKSESPNTMLADMINYIKASERKFRECYAGWLNYSSEEFVKILVIDSCFIIELFFRNAEKRGVEDDPILRTPSMLEVLDHDLILLENQVPWMILERLFRMTRHNRCHGETLIQLAIEFFRNIFPFTISDPPQAIKHIPDLFKKLMVSSMGVEEFGSNMPYRWEPVPSATRLLEAGIKFRQSKSANMFDIKFRNGILEIPQIRIHEITETFIKNLISFEQCYPKGDDTITSYAILLDNLIDTTKDVEILRERNILSICLNPEDAVQFFNKLYHTTCVKSFHYLDLCRDLNKHCQKRLPRWRALLVRRISASDEISDEERTTNSNGRQSGKFGAVSARNIRSPAKDDGPFDINSGEDIYARRNTA
ncbi:UPF0481 protein At3g47200-like [Corylus avellana]|uniref:UPF0481 protein At3g47200-like n=1 Tax=Corylus avellana TaxID=13451 RepID=UPI00286A36B2|nr:UPF0481 protein At3g47200-like [Corylus avellana]